jgi:hypothetical protein
MERREGTTQKPENNDNYGSEYIAEFPSVREQIESLVSDEALSDELAHLKDDLANDPEYLLFAATETEIKQIHEQLRQEENSAMALQLGRRMRELNRDLSSNPRYVEYRRALDGVDSLQHSSARLIYAHSPETELLLGALQSEPGINPLNDQAPFVDYKLNTSEVWKYVPNEAIKDYLDSFNFIDEKMRLEGKSVLLKGDRAGDSFAIPSSLFASMPGFKSWSGRNDTNSKGWNSDYGSDVANSIDVMKHYASLPTELPSLDLVNVYVQPDGRIFAKNHSDGSHRIGAAFLRGDKTVKTYDVNFVMLERNILPSKIELMN